jgi:hypothetical protein
MTGPVTLPTDNHVAPSQGEVFLSGQTEGHAQPTATTAP